MKMNILRIIIIILLLCTFYIIFGFSSQNGEQSGGISRKITIMIAGKIPSLDKIEENQKEEILNKMETVIRKIAHFSIYTAVGILLMSLLNTYKSKNKIRILISLIIGIIYAISDEFHQGFVPGRSPQITDVMIDTAGVIFGIMLVFLVIKCYKNIITGQKST